MARQKNRQIKSARKVSPPSQTQSSKKNAKSTLAADPQSARAKATRLRLYLVAGFAAMVVVVGSLIIANGRSKPQKDNSEPALPSLLADEQAAQGTPAEPHVSKNPHSNKQPKKASGGFLDTFTDSKTDSGEGKGGPVLTNAQLEKKFQALLKTKDRMETIQAKAKKATSGKEIRALFLEHERIAKQLDTNLHSFQNELRSARADRPKDSVPQWLTGELLTFVAGEPKLSRPYLERAVKSGLQRPRLFATLARVQMGRNEFALAYQAALKALKLDGDRHTRYVLNAFVSVAISRNKFAEAVEKLDKAFPNTKPEWATEMRKYAADMLKLWQAEQKLRAQEAKADNLPRVRFLIEHRKFTRGSDGKVDKIESTGKGEVVVELFEDQAPNTVANFITLVEKKFYDGTRFFEAVSAKLVTGGDPLSKNDDPAADGTGHPGYAIAAETNLPNARKHFRGSLSMVPLDPNDPNGPAGSRFFITVVPMPLFDGKCTVFGRVIKGQDIIDHITQGRTNLDVCPFGPIIPGDLLMRAEMIRKRDHKYKVKKLEQPE